MKNKQKVVIIIFIIAVIIALLAGGYLLWKNTQKTPEEKTAEMIDKSIEAATQSALSTINPQSNPLEKLPEINPIEKANPFKNIRTNPFE